MKKLIGAVTFLFLQSCAIFTSPEKIDCSTIDQELSLRYSLFSELSAEEIQSRQLINVPTISPLDKISVFSKIVEAVKKSPPNSKIIPVDLRYYKHVGLGNISINNIFSNEALGNVLKSAKYSQGSFALINFNESAVAIFPPLKNEVFKKDKIDRKDLSDVEIVFNVSDSKAIDGNMKFSPYQKVSILADRIKDPYRLDLRESGNMQFNLNQKWIMKVYSIEDSDLNGGKDTTGLFEFVNNKNTKGIKLHKFSNSKVVCYKDENGKKF